MKSIILLAALTLGYVENDGIACIHTAKSLCDQNGVEMTIYYDVFDLRIARFEFLENKIYINIGHSYWINPLESSKNHFNKHLHSSNNIRHVITHEIGHVLLCRKLGNDKFNALKANNIQPNLDRKIVESVSLYATTDIREFFSEVYAGLRSGVKFSEDIMKEYNRIWNL